MFAILHALGMFVCDLLKSRRRLQAENLFLRRQLNIALRRALPRPRLRRGNRALLVWMTGICPRLLDLAQVVKPETILRWHRAGFAAYWRWKSRKRAGRPKIDRGLRDLILRMSRENPLWGRTSDPWRAANARIRWWPSRRSFAVAKWLCGTSDRHNTARVSGSCADYRYPAFATHPRFVCGLLQPDTHSPGAPERCAIAPAGPAVWTRRRHPNLVRTTPSICADVIFGTDKRRGECPLWSFASLACFNYVRFTPDSDRCAAVPKST